MSTNATQHNRATATERETYPRHNFWGEDVDGNETTGHDPKPFHYHRERAEHVSHDFWKQTAERLLCPVAIREPEDHDLHSGPIEVEISDPVEYVPNGGAPAWHSDTEYGINPNRVRVNENQGYLAGPYIPDREYGPFMSCICDLLDYYAEEYNLTDNNLENLETTAHRRKRAGDDRDVDIVADVMADAWRMARIGE